MTSMGSLALAVLARKHGVTTQCTTHIQPFKDRPTILRITHCIWTLVLAIALIEGSLSAQELPQPGAPNAEFSTGCFATFHLGTFIYCVSEHGNIVRFTAPAVGPEHIRIGTIREGYAVCTATLANLPQASHDAGNTESGFIDPPTIIQPNGPNSLPLTIIRNTALSNLKLTQTFSHSAAERAVTISMTVQNLNKEDRWVRLDRYFDGDIAGDPADDRFNRSADAVWGEDGPHALVLSDVTPSIDPSIKHSTTVQAFDVFNAADCAQASVPTPTAPGDFVGRLSYELDTIGGYASIPGGGKKSVRVQYRKL